MPDDLKNRERFYRDLFENSLDGFVMVDIHSRILDANQAYCRMLGYTLSELRAKKDFYEITPPEWRENERTEFWENRLLKEGYSGVYQKEYIRKDGSRFPVELRAYSVHDSQGSVVYLWAIVRDITDVKRAEKELKDSRDLLKITQELSKVGGWIFDVEQRQMTWTDETYRIHGIDPGVVPEGSQDLVTWSLSCYPEEVRPLIQEAFTLCVEKGTPYTLELPFHTADGRVIWVTTMGRAVFENGRILNVMGNIMDITERKRAEEAIRSELVAQRSLDRANNRVEYILNAIHDGLWEDNFKTGEFQFSDKIFTMLGHEPVRGREGFDFLMGQVHPEDRNHLSQALEKLISGESGSDTWNATFRMMAKNGAWRHILSRGRCVARDNQGRGYHLVGVHSDITELARVEDALRENEKKYRLLVDRLPDIVIRFDRDGRHLFVSDNIREVTGVCARDFIGKTHRDMGVNDKDYLFWEQCIDQVLTTGEPMETEFAYQVVEGKEKIFNWRLAPERDDDGSIQSVLSICRDITDQRKMENDYKTLFREMLDGFSLHEILCDDVGVPVDYRFLAVNPAFERMTGFSAERVVGRTVLEVLPDTERHWIETYGKVALTGEPTCFENVSRTLDKHFEVTAFRPSAGQFACIFSDITERKRAEREILRQSRVLSAINGVFHQTLNAASEEDVAKICLNLAQDITGSRIGFIGETDELGRFNTLTVTVPGWRGQSPDHTQEDQRTSGMEVQGIWGRVIRENKGFFTNDPSSHPDWLDIPEIHPEIRSFLGVPLFRGDQVFGMIAVGNNPDGYTDDHLKDLESLSFAFVESLTRWRTEKAVRTSEKTLSSLFNAISESVCLLEKDGRILAVNETFAKRLDRQAADCVGRSVYSLLPDNSVEKGRNIMEGVVRSGQPLDGMDQWGNRLFHHNAWPVKDNDDTVERVAVFSVDVTDIKRAEAEKERLQSQLNQAQKMESVGRLAGGVAHDFNNMMGVILGHTDMILDQMPASHPLHRDLVEIQKAAQRSAGLTQQLLAFARKQTVSPRVLDLNDTVESMLKMLRRLIGEDVDLEWAPGTRLGSVLMDPSQIDQILVNLCVNARDALGAFGKVTIQTAETSFDQAYCEARPDFSPGDYVMLSVIDNGCGMDKETISRLFEPFFTTKEMGKGTGLGLSTVYGIVRQNKGFISVHSEKDQGTTFKVYLPRHTPKAAQTEAPLAVFPQTQESGTILLVEDEPAILNMTALMLRRQGYQVLTASTPGAAMEIAAKYPEKIQLLMTDVIMPEMNGRDLARNILAVYPDIRRLFMSGYTADVIAHHGVLDKGVHFIQKPFTMQELSEKVKAALAREG